MSGKTIFDNGKHKCIVFSDLVKGEGIQSNQFLILNTDNGETNGAVIDPGGDLATARSTRWPRRRMPQAARWGCCRWARLITWPAPTVFLPNRPRRRRC